MSKLMRVLLVIFGLVSASCSYADEKGINALTGILSGTNSLRANFEHKIFTKKGGLIEQSRGVMALQSPNKFLWQINQPAKDLVIVDGKNLWHYDEELQQATVQVFDESQQLFPMELLLAGDVKDIDSMFTVKVIELKRCAVGSKQCFWLKPKKTEDSVRQIILGFADNSIYYLKLWDQLGQQSEFKFAEVERNPKLGADTFKLTLPTGIDVIGTNSKN